MTKIYKLKEKFVPDVVKDYFYNNYSDCTYEFYWYFDSDDKRIYGCNVYKDGKFYHNATQASRDDFKLMTEVPL